MSIVKPTQRHGEHVQLFALRVDEHLRRKLNLKLIPDSLLLQHTLDGLWPSVRNQLPNPEPATLDFLFLQTNFSIFFHLLTHTGKLQ